jgi:hypothetical protein
MANRSDAKLIELGRQFEQAKAEIRPLEAEKDRLGSLVEDALTQEGLPSDFSPEAQTVRKRIARTVGYNSAYDAFTKKHNVAVRLMKAIHRERPTTIEGIAVKLAAISFDIADFELEPDDGDVAERQIHRLCRQVRHLVGKGAAK